MIVPIVLFSYSSIRYVGSIAHGLVIVTIHALTCISLLLYCYHDDTPLSNCYLSGKYVDECDEKVRYLARLYQPNNTY